MIKKIKDRKKVKYRKIRKFWKKLLLLKSENMTRTENIITWLSEKMSNLEIAKKNQSSQNTSALDDSQSDNEVLSFTNSIFGLLRNLGSQ